MTTVDAPPNARRRGGISDLVVPDMHWSAVRGRVNRLWEARNAPHIAVMGQTRTGKSYLTVHGLMDLCKWDRVLIIDVKGDDETLRGVGRPVRRIPGRLADTMRRLASERRAKENWFRLVAYENFDDAHEQVGEAFERIFDEGDWIVVIDELRAVVDPRPPGINLRGPWERFMLRGGSKGIAMVNLTQEPRWVPHSYYTQSSFFFLGRVEDELSQKRIAEIGSSRALLEHLSRIRKRNWLYMDNEESDRFWARTMVVKHG